MEQDHQSPGKEVVSHFALKHHSGWEAAARRSLKGSEEHQRQSFDRRTKNFEPKYIVFVSCMLLYS